VPRGPLDVDLKLLGGIHGCEEAPARSCADAARAMAIALLQTDLLFDFSLDTSCDKDIRNYADPFRARQRARRELDARRAGMKILRDLKLEAQP
jgi:hypothetical protein